MPGCDERIAGVVTLACEDKATPREGQKLPNDFSDAQAGLVH
jgi:hypothetical protein